MSQNLNILDIGRLFFYLSPFFLLLIIPIACMLSVFLTFLRMNTDRELLALKSSGLSLYQLLPAPAVFCLLCVLLNLVISMYGLSFGMDRFRKTILELARTKTQLVLQPGVFNKDFPGLVVYAMRVDSVRGELSTVFVRDGTREDITATILAPKGRVRTDPEKGEIVFALNNGKIYRREKDGVSVLGFGEYTVRLDLSGFLQGFDLGEVKPKEMSWTRLRALDKDTGTREKHGANYARKVAVEKHKRLALPLACLVLGLFALPMAGAFGGMSRHWGLILALGFFLFYYTLLSLGLSMGEAGSLSPAVGLWFPNIFFLLAGVFGIRITARERSLGLLDRLRHLNLPGRPHVE